MTDLSVMEPATPLPASPLDDDLPDDDRGGRRWRLAVRVAVAVALGLLASRAAISLSGLATRYLAAALVALVGMVTLPLVGSRQRAADIAVAAMALGMSVGFSISFLHRMIVPGKFVAFMGEAEAVTVSLTFVATGLYVGLWMFDRYFYAAFRPLRVCWQLFWPAVLFMIAGILSMFNAADLPLVMLEEFRLLCLLGVTVVVMNFRPRQLDLFLLVLAATVILQAGLASAQFATGRGFGLSIFGEATPELAQVDFQLVARPTGLFGDPNIMAYYFEITLPLMLALALAEGNRLVQRCYALAALAALVGVLVSMSRAAWMTVPVTVGFIMLRLYGRKLLSIRSAMVGVGLLAVASVAMIYIYPLLARRLLGDDAGSMSYRIPLDVAAIGIIRMFPWFGVGLNNFAITFTTYDRTNYSFVRGDIDYVVHNLFLLVWTEVGTVGFLAFLWYFGSVFLATMRLPRANRRARAIALGISTGLFAHWMHGTVDPGYKLNLTISQLIAALVGTVGCLVLAGRGAPAPARRPAGGPEPIGWQAGPARGGYV